MPTTAQPRLNPLTQLIEDISVLEEREGKWAALVQVPLARANTLLGLSQLEWREGFSGFVSDDDIGDLMRKTGRDGAHALSGLTVGYVTRLKVSDGVKGNCKELTILAGLPMEA